METVDAHIQLVMMDCKEAAKEKDFDKRLDKCCKAAKDHWMITDKGKQFKAAIAAAYLESNDIEKKRIEEGLKGMRNVAAMLSGVPVNVDQMVKEMENSKEEGIEPLPLIELFKKHFQ